MTWEDDVLASYEAKKAKADAADTLSMQRNKLLEDNQQHLWHLLRGEIQTICTDLNGKAGRDIFKSEDPRTNYLKLVREDRCVLTAVYDPKTKAVRFESDAIPFAERDYVMTVRPVDGSDHVVWLNFKSKGIESSAEIAKEIISAFLGAGHART